MARRVFLQQQHIGRWGPAAHSELGDRRDTQEVRRRQERRVNFGGTEHRKCRRGANGTPSNIIPQQRKNTTLHSEYS